VAQTKQYDTNDSNNQKLDELQDKIANRGAGITKKMYAGLTLGGGLGGALGLVAGIATGVPEVIMMGSLLGGLGGAAAGRLTADVSMAKDIENQSMDVKRFDAELTGPEAKYWGQYYASAAPLGNIPVPPPFLRARNQNTQATGSMPNGRNSSPAFS